MVYLFAITCLLLIVFMVYKKLNNRYHEELFKYRMFQLRDELRTLAMDKKVDMKSVEFDYMDFSISKSIEQSYFITLFYIIGLEFRHKATEDKLEGYKDAYDRMIKGVINDVHLKQIFIHKNRITREYVLGQNRLLVFIFKNGSWLIKNIFNFRKYIKKILSEVNYMPELSGININGGR